MVSEVEHESASPASMSAPTIFKVSPSEMKMMNLLRAAPPPEPPDPPNFPVISTQDSVSLVPSQSDSVISVTIHRRLNKLVTSLDLNDNRSKSFVVCCRGYTSSSSSGCIPIHLRPRFDASHRQALAIAGDISSGEDISRLNFSSGCPYHRDPSLHRRSTAKGTVTTITVLFLAGEGTT
ncbi:hypothetical protein AALP_AA3G291900 [Arabis alpina]|uniref:Uncharacterized protein n=1 Tax=Arabis alpina TaxID=50452 RepID=A0A087HCG5_ARAAL|nr:hypothetical protein AALP_AA3G291900 [Arabis alpina]